MNIIRVLICLRNPWLGLVSQVLFSVLIQSDCTGPNSSLPKCHHLVNIEEHFATEKAVNI